MRMIRRNTAALVAPLLVGILTGLAPAQDVKIPETHPRLLIHREDLAVLRFRCGLDRYQDDPVARARGMVFGSQRDALARLRAAAREIMLGKARSDDLWAPAMMHLATGELGRPDAFTEYVARELLDPESRRFELDAVVAFDWCFDAVDAERRARITERLADALQPFDPGESAVNDLRFHRKLVSLAAAIALAGDALPADGAKQATQVRTVLNTAKGYLEGPFVRFCQQRGAMPTSGGNGVWEEANLVLAVELWRTGAGRSLWPKLTDSLGRSMEHYLYADTEDQSLPHGFIHDDGSDTPARPGQILRGFAPAVSWAAAANTRDPIATWYAHRSLTESAVASSLTAERYLWVALVYGPLDQAEVARRACPLGRNFGGGWIAMRGGWRPGDTVVLFDAGQPFWRARQHFDAGQFQIYRRGRLAIDSGDDVTFEAITSKGGRTTIGADPGDWDNYFQATIAHNCVTVSDPALTMSVYGRPWPAAGNQRLIGYDYDLSAGDIGSTDRATGRLTAFETNSFYTYASADLTSAYWPQVVKAIERRLLFVNDGALCVLDRVRAAGPRAHATWHLQLPGRPQFVGPASTGTAAAGSGPADRVVLRDLSQARQVHGVSDRAGIWELAGDQPWLVVTQQRGRLYARTLLPENARRCVAGGPMQARQIPAGTSAGRTYFGGEPAGYEYRLVPATLLHGPNAAYVLGQPTGLGINFGVGATWGRLDVSLADEAEIVTFLHLLVPTDADVNHPPPVRFERRGALAVLDLELARHRVRIELALGDGPPGRVVITDGLTGGTLFDKMISSDVVPDLPIPGSSRSSAAGTQPR